MKKILCFLVVLCIMTTIFCGVVSAADFEMYDFYENIDAPFSCDFDGDGSEESFWVDSYRNHLGFFLFYINDIQYVFDSSWKGSYSDFAIIDLDETDRFKEILVFFSHKTEWFNIYRYDGGKLFDLTEIPEFLAGDSEEPISLSADGGVLTLGRGDESTTYRDLKFEEAELMSGVWNGEDGDYDQYPVEFNGERMVFDQSPVNKKDRILVPIRAIFEKMGYSIAWDDSTKTVYAMKDKDYIVMQIRNKQIYYSTNGVSGIYECDVAPMIVGGRTVIPLRGVAECAGCTVLWEDEIAKIITK